MSSLTIPQKVRQAVFISCLLFSAGFSTAADIPASVAGYTPAEALRLGERMYLDGILPSGEPITAIVQDDLEISGKMTTCANCHLRSGLGSFEGGVVTPPTNGAKIFAPLEGPQDIPGTVMKRTMATTKPRPAYTDESLAKLLTSGYDPTGRKLLPTMPRYLLGESDMQIMTFYLRNLNASYSPGVTNEEIRFATIVTPDLKSADRDAMILPIKAFIADEWNARLSDIVSPWNSWNLSVKKVDGRSYRKASLDVWELKGSAATWPKQLEEYYRTKPVFSIIGGMAPGSWNPIHAFCENNRIPCILPITELPEISGKDWFTFYFSKGYHQEGEAAASYLSRVFDLPPEKQIVQVFRATSQGKAIAAAFSESWKTLGGSPLHNRIVVDTESTGSAFWEKLCAENPNAVLLVWLDQSDMAGLAALPKTTNRPSTILFSSTMLNGALASIPDGIRDVTFITYPARLPGESDYSRSLVTNWMKFKKLPITNLTISSKMYTATRLISAALVDMGTDFYRDYFLDILDENSDQPNSSISYPMLSFGPGQRYASKGCYIVTITKGENPAIVRQSDWVIY